MLGVAASYERHHITERTAAGRVQAKSAPCQPERSRNTIKLQNVWLERSSRSSSRWSRCVVELPDMDDAFIEIVKQARIDSHLAKIPAKRVPMSTAAAHRTMVNTDHVIAPD